MKKIKAFAIGLITPFIMFAILNKIQYGEYTLTFWLFALIVGLIIGTLNVYIFGDKKEEIGRWCE